jgi:hypothetical protein
LLGGNALVPDSVILEKGVTDDGQVNQGWHGLKRITNSKPSIAFFGVTDLQDQSVCRQIIWMQRKSDAGNTGHWC